MIPKLSLVHNFSDQTPSGQHKTLPICVVFPSPVLSSFKVSGEKTVTN